MGQGQPTTGGIPTFVAGLVGSGWLRGRADVSFLNTTPRSVKHPGRLDVANLRAALRESVTLFRLSRRADVVHLNVAAAPALPLTRALALAVPARVAGACVIVHAHTGRLDRAAASPGYRLLLRAVGRVASIVIVVSRAGERAARPLCRRVEYLPNGIDAGAFRAACAGRREGVVFVGTVCERKGLLDLRDALVAVRERHGGRVPFSVVIVGDGRQEGPGAERRVRAAYEAAGLAPAVRFVGALSHEDVVGVLGGAAVFCLPSHWEGSPLSLLEAMASGLAPVAAGVGDVPEILDGGAAGLLVPPRDPAALADALERVALDEDLRTRLADAARCRVVAEYTNDRVVERLFGLYLELAARRRHSM